MDKLIYAILLNKSKTDNLQQTLSGIEGIDKTALNAISFRKISAVCGSFNKSAFAANKAVAIAFAGVIDELAKHFTLLPMRFGSFMKTNDDIAKMLELNHDGFLQNLEKVDTKLEFGLKVFGDSTKIQEHLRAANPAEEITLDENEASKFKAYVNKKLQAHRLEERTLAFVDTIVAEITKCLKQLEATSKIRKMTSESILVDGVFLVKKNQQQQLVDAIGDLQKQYPEIKFVLTGPWPPYSFVEIKLK